MARRLTHISTPGARRLWITIPALSMRARFHLHSTTQISVIITVRATFLHLFFQSKSARRGLASRALEIRITADYLIGRTIRTILDRSCSSTRLVECVTTPKARALRSLCGRSIPRTRGFSIEKANDYLCPANSGGWRGWTVISFAPST